MSDTEIHRELYAVYSQNVISEENVRQCYRMFKDGRSNVHDEERSGRPAICSEWWSCSKCWPENLRKTVHHNSRAFVWISTIYDIITVRLGCHKFYARCVLKMLTRAHKTQRMASAFVDFFRAISQRWRWIYHSHRTKQVTKPGFHLWMLKQKISQNSGCTHIHQTIRKKFKQTDGSCFFFLLDRKGVLVVEFMQQGTKISSQMYCETLKLLRRASHSEQKTWNADIRCNTTPWRCVPTYNCSHSSIAGAFKLGVVWPPFLHLLFRSERLPPFYLPEELVEITALQQ
jgi:hypothetical protein